MKKVTSLMLLILILLSLSACENKNGWYGDYYYDNNKKVKNDWRQYGNDWYYCGPKGEILRNKWIDDEYYVDENGKMLVNTYTPDGYFVGQDGKYITKFEMPHPITYYGYNTNINVIDFVTFGYDNVSEKPIEWFVLDRSDGKVLLFSKNIIAKKQYHTDNIYVSWKQSYLYQWLNNDFYNNCFNIDEKNQIIGEDKVFLLSTSDIEKYFGHVKRIGYGPGGKTSYVIYDLLNTNEYFWYNTDVSYGTGPRSNYWITGTMMGSKNVDKIINENGVRPAIWVKY